MARRKFPFFSEMLAFSPKTLKILKKGRITARFSPKQKAGEGKGVDPAPCRKGEKKGAKIEKQGKREGNDPRDRLPYAGREEEKQGGG